MTNPHDAQHRAILQRIACRAMLERGLLPDFSAQALAELDKIQAPAAHSTGPTRDCRNLIWCSIDNDTSRDLDQLTVAQALPGGCVKVLVAIADVDALVKRQSAIDEHAQHNTMSIYTAAQIFPMLPEKLSTDLTSLGLGADRGALVVEMTFTDDGSLQGTALYPALVRNHAKLAYTSVAAWLDGIGSQPAEITAVAGLDQNLRLQDNLAQKLKTLRHVHGALNFETIEARPVFDGNALAGLEPEKRNRAKDIIEDFMIAANSATAHYLASIKFPSIRRVVRTPKRWDRIVELAVQHGTTLPPTPDAKALEQFLAQAKAAGPLRFPDLSLSVIQLLGPGEYVVELPGVASAGHFGLAVKDYLHSTAPNRRFPDLITQRLLKAALTGQPAPYANAELDALARHCTQKENDIKKVERQVVKSAAAMLLETRRGEQFDAFVTGASAKGTWVRILHPPVEGRLTRGFEGLDVGQRLTVKLVYTDVERGFIDFEAGTRIMH
jgi:exoribonuclease-2